MFRNSGLLVLLYAWLLISSSAVALIFYLEPDASSVLLGLKDAPIYLLLLWVILFSRATTSQFSASRIFILVLLYFGFSFLLSSAEVFVKFAATRQLFSFFALVLLGVAFSGHKNVRWEYYRSITKLGILVIVFGFFELFYGIWGGGFLVPFFESKSIGVFESGYPFLFIEPIPEILQGIIGTDEQIRMTSTLLDPINLAHAIVFWISIIYLNPSQFKDSLKRKMILTALLIGLFFTFSKGAWLQLVLALIVFNSNENIFVRIALVSVLAIAIPIAFVYVPGGEVHLGGLLASFQTASLFGFGLGMVGNYAAMFGQNLEWGIGDSFLGTLIGEIGLVGSAVWIVSVFIVIRQLPKDSFLRPVIVSQLIVSMLSENAFNLLSIAGIAVSIGAEISWRQVKEHHVKGNAKSLVDQLMHDKL